MPTAAQHHAALAALDAVPGGFDLVYARVDLLPDDDGPVVVELELIEPTLFLQHSPAATERLADAIMQGRARPTPG